MQNENVCKLIANRDATIYKDIRQYLLSDKYITCHQQQHHQTRPLHIGVESLSIIAPTTIHQHNCDV
jgi:hypothetical protein